MSDSKQKRKATLQRWINLFIIKWSFILLIVPLFWFLMFVVIGETTLVVWLLAMTLYISLLLYVGGKINTETPRLTEQTEKLRSIVGVLGRVEFGLFFLAVYYFVFMLVFHGDELSAR